MSRGCLFDVFREFDICGGSKGCDCGAANSCDVCLAMSGCEQARFDGLAAVFKVPGARLLRLCRRAYSHADRGREKSVPRLDRNRARGGRVENAPKTMRFGIHCPEYWALKERPQSISMTEETVAQRLAAIDVTGKRIAVWSENRRSLERAREFSAGIVAQSLGTVPPQERQCFRMVRGMIYNSCTIGGVSQTVIAISTTWR